MENNNMMKWHEILILIEINLIPLKSAYFYASYELFQGFMDVRIGDRDGPVKSIPQQLWLRQMW